MIPHTHANGSQPWAEFDIHGRMAFRVAANAPTVSILLDMCAPFRASGLDRYDLTITGQHEAMPGASHAEHELRYTNHGVHLLKSDVQIVVDGDGYRLHGRRELLTAALPLIDRILVRWAVAMIHAATVAYKGRGIVMAAWGGVGKTSTIAKMLRHEGTAFMGDDWAFIDGAGQLLGYHKPMFIKPHYRSIYPHLFAAKRKPLVPRALSKPIAELTTIVHPLVTQYPRVARFTRRWSPEHLMVTPAVALPGTGMATAAPLDLVVFVERFDGARPVLEEHSVDWMVTWLAGNFYAELPRHSREVMTALAATGFLPLDRIFQDKRAVLAAGVDGRPAYRLRVPAAWSADHASDEIVEHLLRLVEPAEAR